MARWNVTIPDDLDREVRECLEGNGHTERGVLSELVRLAVEAYLPLIDKRAGVEDLVHSSINRKFGGCTPNRLHWAVKMKALELGYTHSELVTQWMADWLRSVLAEEKRAATKAKCLQGVVSE